MNHPFLYLAADVTLISPIVRESVHNAAQKHSISGGQSARMVAAGKPGGLR